MPENNPGIAGLILAAGGGSRLGGGKLLLPWRGRSLVAHAIGNALEADCFASLTVVLGHEAGKVRAVLHDDFGRDFPFATVENPRWSEGQSTSLLLGLNALAARHDERLAGVAVLLGDQPLVQPQTLRLLAASHLRAIGDNPEHPATAPEFEGKRGNPVILSPSLFPALAGLTGDTGARGVLAGLGDGLLRVPVADSGVTRDVDTPESYSSL